MELNYQITLTSVPFDNSYKNVLRFDTRSEQEAYFQTNTLFSNSPRVNFNVGSLYATNIVYDGAENESIGELLNKNYCIIKDNRENRKYDFYYYFVTNAIQDCDNRIKLSLELDIFQTYYIDLNFGDSVIYKAHLNRFIDNGDGTISFDGTETSKLFEREDIKNVSKRMKKREKVSIFDSGKTEIDNWLNENVIGWIYAYVEQRKYKFKTIEEFGTQPPTEYEKEIYSLDIATFEEEAKDGVGIYNPFSCLAFPILKENQLIKFADKDQTNKYVSLGSGAFRQFIALNGVDYIYSLKFSTTPPFNKIIDEAEIVENAINGTTLVIKGRLSDNGIWFNTGNSIVARESAICLVVQPPYFETKYNNDIEYTFRKEDIIGANKNPKFNPKLLNGDYRSLKLSDSTENGFEYDLQKLNKNDLKIKLTEPFLPDITKKYIRFSNLNGMYIEETSQNLTGFVTQNDNSLSLTNDQFKSMLANNKNFFLQNSINRRFGLTQGLISSGVAIAGGIGNPLQTTIGVIGGLRSIAEATKSIINENLTIDNLQNAPDIVNLAKGNSIFENMYSKNGIIIEEWDLIDNEKEMINDYMCLYGFTYNRVDNVKNVDNIRKFYNFVRADIETINGATISETVHQKFRQCFANGVRFWNVDTFNYNKENYERWLENE